MPKAPKDTPETLKPYLFHGVLLDWDDGDKEAIGDCPWCGRERKFSVNIRTGQWRCFVCAEGTGKGGGNARVFIRKLHEESDKATNQYSELAEHRGLLSPDTLMHWNIVRSIITGDWLVPGYGADGKLNQLYKYFKAKDRWLLLPTPTLGHQIHGWNLYDPKKSTVYVCEGIWDGLAWWETLSQAKSTETGLKATANQGASLLADANVLAIPGCGSVGEPFKRWLPLFAGKKVRLLFDSDHPRENEVTHVLSEPAGYGACRRAVEILLRAKPIPEEVSFLRWGPEGYNPSLPSGTDLRDVLTGRVRLGKKSPETGLAGRLTAAEGLLRLLSPIPENWATAQKKGAAKSSISGREVAEEGLGCLPCTNYRQLVMAWRKAMKWTEGLDHGLSVALASVASTGSVGDQLWIKIIGPASCGKSTLAEAISVSPYVVAKSTIRGFHSGYKVEGADGEEVDVSLISQVAGKTLVTKDGDTLLQSPNLEQILSEARDIYDSTSRSHYRNNMGKDYLGIRMTWLLCGTSSLRQIDSSELGERFLDCVIMEGIDDDLEDEILMRVAHRADRALALEATGDITQQYEPEMANAMQLTGGYVNYLRENATDLLSTIDNPDWAKRLCTRLGKFVAHMRARPSSRQDETAEREFAARLVSQHIRLAKCLALVLNRKSVDKEVMRRVRRVSLDTSRGQTLDLVRHLHGEIDGMENRTLSLLTSRPESKTKEMLRFLKMIGVVDQYVDTSSGKGMARRQKWVLTARMRKLYNEVYKELDDA